MNDLYESVKTGIEFGVSVAVATIAFTVMCCAVGGLVMFVARVFQLCFGG